LLDAAVIPLDAEQVADLSGFCARDCAEGRREDQDETTEPQNESMHEIPPILLLGWSGCSSFGVYLPKERFGFEAARR
jgi:hypothetical protein